MLRRLLRKTALKRKAPMARKRSPNDPDVRLREYVRERDGFRCVATVLGLPHQCSPGLPHQCSPWLGMGCGHVIPRARGGKTVARNLVWMCNVANETQVREQRKWEPSLLSYVQTVERRAA